MPARDKVDLWALSDLCTPWCVHVVATLRIADHIAAGITQIDDLAAASGSDARFPAPSAEAPRRQGRV